MIIWDIIITSNRRLLVIIICRIVVVVIRILEEWICIIIIILVAHSISTSTSIIHLIHGRSHNKVLCIVLVSWLEASSSLIGYIICKAIVRVQIIVLNLWIGCSSPVEQIKLHIINTSIIRLVVVSETSRLKMAIILYSWVTGSIASLSHLAIRNMRAGG